MRRLTAAIAIVLVGAMASPALAGSDEIVQMSTNRLAG